MSSGPPYFGLTASGRLVAQARGILDQAREEGRILSQEEYDTAQALLTKAEEARVSEKWVDDMGHRLGGGGPVIAPMGSVGVHITPDDPGTVFVESKGYLKYFGKDASRPVEWTIDPVEVSPPGYQTKGTFGELGAVADNTRGPIGGGALVSVPQVVPGVVDKLFQRLTIADLLLSGQAAGPTIRYVVEGTAVSGAAGVPDVNDHRNSPGVITRIPQVG